jgi:hypothetical protein
MASWFPWVFVGGIAFMVLSFVASKYQGKSHKTIAWAQDFISGGIVVGLLGVLVPDAFPAFPVDLSGVSLSSLTQTVKGPDEMDLQVGPLRR